ncbi:MAG: hypothetical protein NT020_08510 [Chloroflexales bacterium]|nr:hypothetical protein [Chloroflexales bacterium]
MTFPLPHVRWQSMLIAWYLLLLANCGNPIQLINHLAQPNRTQLVDAGSNTPESTATAIPAVSVGITQSVGLATNAPKTDSGVEIPNQTERWGTFFSNRVAFGSPQKMTALAPSPLLWLDPRNGQVLEIGMLNGDFAATAHLVLKSDNQAAFEVEYTINQNYGLTSISEAIVQRMHSAGFEANVRGFVIAGDSIVQAP